MPGSATVNITTVTSVINIKGTNDLITGSENNNVQNNSTLMVGFSIATAIDKGTTNITCTTTNTSVSVTNTSTTTTTTITTANTTTTITSTTNSAVSTATTGTTTTPLLLPLAVDC